MVARLPYQVRNAVRTCLQKALFAKRKQAHIRTGPLAGYTVIAPFNERVSFGLGSYEPAVTEVIRGHAGAETVFYDIGAHIGWFSLVAAKCGAQVYSFEANPENAAVLRQNLALNQITRAEVVAAAVAAEEGELEFATFEYSLVGHIADANLPADARVMRVPAVSLDTYVGSAGVRPPTLLKIDVEGAEGEVIRGAVATLREHRPVLAIEIHNPTQQQRVYQLTEPLGYRWSRIGAGAPTLVPGETGQFLGTAVA